MSSAVRYARMQPQMMMKQQQKRRRMSYLKLVSSSRARARVRARATAEEEEEREMFRERIFNDGIVSTGRLSSPTREYESETLCPMVLSQWRSANAVCFDIDCTVCKNDSMDALAAFLGKSDEVKYWTDKAMEGHMDLEHSLEERMKIIDPTPDDIQAYLKACPAEERLNHGIKRLVRALTKRGVEVYLISGGFREMALPVARELGVHPDNVFA